MNDVSGKINSLQSYLHDLDKKLLDRKDDLTMIDDTLQKDGFFDAREKGNAHERAKILGQIQDLEYNKNKIKTTLDELQSKLRRVQDGGYEYKYLKYKKKYLELKLRYF